MFHPTRNSNIYQKISIRSNWTRMIRKKTIGLTGNTTNLERRHFEQYRVVGASSNGQNATNNVYETAILDHLGPIAQRDWCIFDDDGQADNKTRGCRSDHYFSQDLNQGGVLGVLSATHCASWSQKRKNRLGWSVCGAIHKKRHPFFEIFDPSLPLSVPLLLNKLYKIVNLLATPSP